MRKCVSAAALLLAAAAALTGCRTEDHTGEVGQKNLRPYEVDDYTRNGNRVNGTHSFGSPVYRTRFASDQANERNRWLGRNGLGQNIVGTHDNYRLEMNDRIAKVLTTLPEVDSAFVLLTDRSAYVGIVQKRGAGAKAMSAGQEAALKDKVADRVRAMSHMTRNVYVTSNPEFLDRLRGYAEAARQGHPIQGFLAEFNALAERIFPATSGTSGTARSATDLSNDTGTDTGTESGSALTGRYGTYGTFRSYGPLGTSGFGARNR